MSTDLKYLAFTAILTASLWIPYVIAQVTTNGPLKPQNYVDPTPRPLPLWGKRADRRSGRRAISGYASLMPPCTCLAFPWCGP